MARWWQDDATLERLEQIARHKAAQPGAAPIEVQRQIATRALAPRPEYVPPEQMQIAPVPEAQPSRWETYTMTPAPQIFEPRLMLPGPTMREHEPATAWDRLMNTQMPTWLEDYHQRVNEAWAKVTAPREDPQLPGVLEERQRLRDENPLLGITGQWGQLVTRAQQNGTLPQTLPGVLAPLAHDIKQIPALGLVPRVGQAVAETGLAAMMAPEEFVEQTLGQASLRQSQRMAQLMREDPDLAATLMGSQFDVGRVWYNLETKGYQDDQIRKALREVSRITYSGPEAAEAAAVRVIHGEDVDIVTWGQDVNVAEPSQDDVAAYLRYINAVYESAIQQGVDEDTARQIAKRAEQDVNVNGRIPGEGKIFRELIGQIVLDPLNISDEAQKLARIPRATQRARAGLGVVDEAAQAAATTPRIARVAEDLAPPMSPFVGTTLPPSATGFIADVPEELATAARTAERVPLPAAAAEFLAERTEESRALSRYTSAGPLFSPNVPQNVADVAEGLTRQAERGMKAAMDDITPDALRRWAERAWKKVNPFELTDASRARVAVDDASVVFGTLLSESLDAEDAADIFKRFVNSPESLAPILGNLGSWERSKEARKLLAPLVEGIDELPSMKAALEGGVFHKGDFLMELDRELMKFIAAAEATGPKGLIDYQRFADNYRSLMSEFYLRTFGYALRNATSDLVTMANDGLLSLDSFDTVIGDLTKIGPATPRIERAIRGVGLGLAEEMQMGGESILSKLVGRVVGRGAGEVVSGISERVGTFMATGRIGKTRTIFGEESRYLKAFHTGLMRVLGEVWNPTIPDELAQALGPARTAALQGRLRRALTSEEMVDAVRRTVRDTGVSALFDYGKYLGDDVDSLSVETIRRLDAALRNVETQEQATEVFNKLIDQLDDDLGRVLAGDPLPPVRSVNSAVERLQDAAEDGATLEKVATDAGIDPATAERLAGQHVNDMQGMQQEIATLETTVMEQARVIIEAGQDPKAVASALRGLRVEIGQIQMDTRGAVDKARREVYEQLRSVRNSKLSGRALSARAESIWNTYYDDVRRIRSDEQSQIRGLLQNLQTSLASGQVPETAPDVVAKATQRYRSQLEQLAQRRERLGRAGAGEVLNIAEDEHEFASELERMRLAFDEAQAEAWRVGLVNPSTDALDVLSQSERDAQHIGAVAAQKAERVYEQWRATWGRSDEWTKAKFREMVDPIWRQAFADQANRMDLARHELFSLPLGDQAAQTLMQTLGWPAEAMQTLSPDAVRLVLKDRIPWDPAVGGPVVPVAQLEEWTLEGVARNLGIDLTDPRAIDAHDWRRIAELAERDAQLYRALSSEEALFWHIASRSGEEGLAGMTAGLRTLRGVRDLTADDPAFIERMRRGAERLDEVAASARARQYVGTRALGQGIETIPEGAEYVERVRKGDLYQVRVMSHGKMLSQATFDNAAEALRESQRIEDLLSHGVAVAETWVPVGIDDAVRRFGIDSTDPDDLQRLVDTAQGRAADILARTTKDVDLRRKAQFDEAVEAARRLRGDNPADEAMYAQGMLPKGFGLGGETQYDRGVAIARGIEETTDEWYKAISTETEDAEEIRKLGEDYVAEVLRLAGVSDLELSKLNYRQRMRLVEEIGQGGLITTKSGVVSKIGDMTTPRRLHLRDTVTDDIRRLAQGAVMDPARALAYEWLDIADKAMARQDTLKLLRAGIIEPGDVEALVADPAARRALLETLDQIAAEADEAARQAAEAAKQAAAAVPEVPAAAPAAAPDLSQGPGLFGTTDMPIFSGTAPTVQDEKFIPKAVPDAAQTVLPGAEDALRPVLPARNVATRRLDKKGAGLLLSTIEAGFQENAPQEAIDAAWTAIEELRANRLLPRDARRAIAKFEKDPSRQLLGAMRDELRRATGGVAPKGVANAVTDLPMREGYPRVVLDDGRTLEFSPVFDGRKPYARALNDQEFLWDDVRAILKPDNTPLWTRGTTQADLFSSAPEEAAKIPMVDRLPPSSPPESLPEVPVVPQAQPVPQPTVQQAPEPAPAAVPSDTDLPDWLKGIYDEPETRPVISVPPQRTGPPRPGGVGRIRELETPEVGDSLLHIFEDGDLDPEINEAVHRLAAGGMPVTEAADLGLKALDDPQAKAHLLSLASMRGGMFVDEIVNASRLAGQAVEPPTLGDMADVLIQQQKRLLGQIRDGMLTDWDDLHTLSGEGVPPWVGNRAAHWARAELPKQWARSRTIAVEAARNMADTALLDYGVRRRADTWLGMVTPYSYWKTRSARNWAIRLSQQPATLAHYMRYKQAMDRYAQQQGYRARFRGTVPVPTGKALPEWMGGELYVNPESLFFPFAEMAPNEWEDPAEANNAVDYLYRTLNKYGFRPYGFLDAGLRATGLAGTSGMPSEGTWYQPLTSTPQGTLIQAARTLRRPEEMGPVENLFGQLNLEEWDAYRIDRMLANMAADDPTRTQPALLAQALVERIAMGEFDPREVLEGGPNIQRWTEVYGVSPEELAAAQQVLGAAWLRMQQEKALPGAISTMLPVSGRPYPTGERSQLQMQRESAAAGYDPLTRTGSRAQYEAYMAEHPEAYTRAVSYQMIPGSEPINEETWTPLERRGTLIYQPEKQAALEELGQQQLHLLATGGLWNRDPIRNAREEHTQAMTTRREELSVGEFAWPEETTTFTPMYGSTPEEGLREAQEEVLGLISNAVPRYADFESAKEYQKAVKTFYKALAAGDYETAGVTLPQNLPQAALDYGTQIKEEDLVKFWQENDTLAEALVEGFSGWYGEQWDRYYAAKGRDLNEQQLARLTDTQRDAYYAKRDEAWQRYVEQNQLTPDELIGRVAAQYEGRWTPEEIREALGQIKMPTTFDAWMARKTPEERTEYEASERLNDAKEMFWDAYWSLPEDPDWRSTKGQPIVAFIIDKDTRNMATAEQYLAAAAVLRRYVEDFGAEEGEESGETTSKSTGTGGKTAPTAGTARPTRTTRPYYGGGGGGSRRPTAPQEPETWDDVRQSVSGALTRQLSDYFLRSKALDPGALREIEALMTKLGWKGTLEAFLELLQKLFKTRAAPTGAPKGQYRYRD